MSLQRVEVTQEVLLAMLSHAHSTESEEVMGLLLGDILDDPPSGGGAVCRVSLAFPQIRTDRRKDRVETSPEQMARCTAHAERLSRESGLRTRVVGWYHSHPHITVLPSHVDVRTQAMYQLLDPGFVGLIVSAFNRDPTTQTCTVQLTAFQSLPDGDPHSSAASAAAVAAVAGGPGGAADGTAAAGSGTALSGVPAAPLAASSAYPPPFSGGPLVRKEVAVAVVPSMTALEQSFSDMLVVQRILFMEEKEVYKAAVAAAATVAASTGGAPGPCSPSLELTEVHHAGVYQAHTVRLLETSLRPSLAAVAGLVAQQRTQAEQLARQVKELERRLGEGAGVGAEPGLQWQ